MTDEREETCKSCGKHPLNVFFMCDEEDGSWCPECFDEHPCGRGEHGEGCPTKVFA